MRLAVKALAFIALLLASQAHAASVLQGGNTTPGHVPTYSGTSSQPVVTDGGGSGGGALNINPGELGITSRSPTNVYPSAASGNGPDFEHWCMYDAPTNNATGYHYLCLDPNAAGGGLISYGHGGTASSLPMQFRINGVTYQFPFSISGILGPPTTTVGDFMVWNNTTGTLASDYPAGSGVLTALGIAVGSAGGPVVNGGTLGTPSSGTLTNATGLPVATGIAGLGSKVAQVLAEPIGSAGGTTAVVATNAQLKALASTYAPTVIRKGFFVAGDTGQDISYASSNSACSLNAGAGDNGYQVEASDGNCWIASLPTVGSDLRIWGPACDGATDDTAIYVAAGTALNLIGGGLILQPPKVCYSATGFTLPVNVMLGGPITEEGAVTTNNYANQPFTLLLNSAGTVNLSLHSGVRGINIVRYGITAPTTLRGYLTEVGNYAGTAVTCNRAVGSASDVDIDHVFIVGFAQAINSSCDRTTITHVKGDNTAGALIYDCYDLCVLEDVKWWPYIAGVDQVGPETQISTVTAAVNNGSGLIRLTLSAVPPYPIQTGDTVFVGAVGGVTNGGLAVADKFIATAISNTVIDLQGSTFGGTYTSGGTVFLDGTFRSGDGFTFYNTLGGPLATNIEQFGYQVCVDWSGTTGGSFVVNGFCDGELASAGEYNKSSEMLLQKGTANRNSFSGWVDGPAYIMANLSTDAYGLFTIGPGTIVGASTASGVVPIYDYGGTIVIDGADLELPGGGYLYYIGPLTTQGIRVSNTYAGGTAEFYNTATDCPLFTTDGQIGPCPFTPVLFGSSTAGTQTYTTQTGWWIETHSVVTTSVEINLSALGGSTAGQLAISGPVTSAGSPTIQSCSAPIYFNTNLASTFYGVAGSIANAGSILLAKTGAGGIAGLLPSDISSTFHIYMICEYRSS